MPLANGFAGLLAKASRVPAEQMSSPLLFYGFVTAGVQAAFSDACRRLGLVLHGEPKLSLQSKSCGGSVRSVDGAITWLKVSGVPSGSLNERRVRETEVIRHVAHIRTPQAIESVEWTADGVEWRAVRMTLEWSPTVVERMRNGDASLAHDDRWIGMLREALDQVAAIPSKHQCRSPDYVAGAIQTRFGAEAPQVATDWRTAHGDLSWGNITAPELMLLDWETWGLAPCGYDIAYLIVHSFEDRALMHRLEREFEHEFSTPSGQVALLTACAEMLNEIERNGSDREHGESVMGIAQRALSRQVRT